MKVLVIGIDGATWDVLDNAVLANHLPNLNRIRNNGTSGILRSTLPALTPPAWTTCTSGCDPHIHGLAHFEKYSFKDNCLRMTNSSMVRVPSMWHYLGEQGYRVASLNVPFTYPIYPINGMMVSGLGCPGTTSEFIYPHHLKDQLLNHIPDYEITTGLDKFKKECKNTVNHPEKFRQSLKLLERLFEQRYELACWVQDKHPVDIMMVEFQQMDVLQHLCWPLVSPQTRDQYPQHRDSVFELFEKLDRLIGKLLEMINLNQDLLVVVSDHGFGPMNYWVHLNLFLHKWGYLRRANLVRRIVRRSILNWRKHTKTDKRSKSLTLKKPINWPKTKAIVPTRPNYGAIFLNVKGRQPGGCINPGAEYDSVINDLRQKFSEVVNPFNGEKIFTTVATPDELFGNDEDRRETYGDLMLIQKEGYRISLSTNTTIQPVEKAVPDRFDASWHHSDGIYILNGKGINQQTKADANIADIAPTIYAWLNMPIPAEVTGTPILQGFTETPHAQKLQQRNFPKSFTEKHFAESTEDEQEHLMNQLKNLGYFE